MHALLFSLKRAFHSSLRLTRSPLAAYALTPARFDLMAVIEQNGMRLARQSDVWRALGVSRTTVSRMVASLEEIGLVACERDCSDRRQRVVRLTAEGLRAVSQATRSLVSSGAVTLALECLLSPRWFSPSDCLIAFDGFQAFMDRVRDGLGDTATFYVGWHPDD